MSLHDLFERQTLDLLERADIDEEQKQSILIAMSCPCCGAGGMSYTVKLKRETLSLLTELCCAGNWSLQLPAVSLTPLDLV